MESESKDSTIDGGAALQGGFTSKWAASTSVINLAPFEDEILVIDTEGGDGISDLSEFEVLEEKVEDNDIADL